MNTPRIESALKEIEASLPEGEAKVRIDVYGGGVDESYLRGNRTGIARLGVSLVRAAIGEETKKCINGEPEIGGAIDDVFHPNSDVKLDWVELADDLEHEPKIQSDTRRASKRAGWLGWIAVVLVAVVVLPVLWI